jgi:hypothetical protein
MKLGARYTRPHPAVRLLAARARLDLMTPKPCDWWQAIPVAGLILANNEHGDCWPIARRWCITARRANAAGDVTPPTIGECLGDYSDLEGFDPTTGVPDNGTDTDAGMTAWCSKGVRVNDQVLDIVHRVLVDPTNDAHLALAIGAAGPVMGTWRIPKAMMDPSVWGHAPGTGVDWDTIEGEHETALGATDGGAWVTARTWGLDLPVHPDIRRRFLIDVDVGLDLSPGGWMQTTGLTPAGLDVAALAADMRAVVG